MGSQDATHEPGVGGVGIGRTDVGDGDWTAGEPAHGPDGGLDLPLRQFGADLRVRGDGVKPALGEVRAEAPGEGGQAGPDLNQARRGDFGVWRGGPDLPPEEGAGVGVGEEEPRAGPLARPGAGPRESRAPAEPRQA